MNNGWIKLHRSFLQWEWYDDKNCKILMLHLLLKANHRDKRYKGKLVKRGELLTGRDKLAKETGLTPMQIRTALTRLNSTNEITSKTSSQGTVIQINNYDKYQTTTNEVTNEQPTNNQQITTNKKEKKEKNNIPSLETFKDYASELCAEYNWYVPPIEVELKYRAWRDNDWHNGLDKPIKNWKTSLRNTLKYMKQDKQQEPYVPKYMQDIQAMTTK